MNLLKPSNAGRRVRWTGAALLLVLAGAIPARAAHASEGIFGYVYTTDLDPKGELEWEQWITDREGQAHGRYHGINMRTELEYGLTDNLQVAGYLNYSYLSARNNSVNRDTSGLDIPGTHDPSRAYDAFRFDSFSAEMIYRVMSPYIDPIGLAFYVEPEIGPRERALELRVIAQKNFLDDRMILAANVWAELEREDDGIEIEKATMLEFDLGLSYRIAPRWFVGLEFRNHNEFEGYTLSHSQQEHTAFFLGPVLHYASQEWWATLTVLDQIQAIGYNPEQRDNMVHNRIYGGEHTRYDGIRLKFGFEF